MSAFEAPSVLAARQADEKAQNLSLQGRITGQTPADAGRRIDRVLATVRAHPGSTCGKIAAFLGYDAGGVSINLRSLERQGYIERHDGVWDLKGGL